MPNDQEIPQNLTSSFCNSGYIHNMPWGAQGLSLGRARFHLWAPAATGVMVELTNEDPALVQFAPMELHQPEGHWVTEVPCQPNALYRFCITLPSGETLRIADPASRSQNGEMDGESRVLNPASFPWQNTHWKGRPWHEAVVYELHVGLLGGFAGVMEKLPSLKALGITAIELMPVADFPGLRNWGYDGILPFAPDTAYGTPNELKHLIDTAHGLGLMVLLDVVYNHFGPEGNYLHTYAPAFFKRGEPTAWGDAIDFDQRSVRSFFTHNALYWLMEYRFDGLRIDAAQAIAAQDWLVEMADCVRSVCEPGRSVHLVLEHEGNAAGLLKKGFDAQWNDDLHHVLHGMLTGEQHGPYADYAQQPAQLLARCLAEGFAYQGETSGFRKGALRGEASGHLPPTAFIFYLQNHDQIGNRPFGERLSVLAHPAALRAAQALQLLSPHIPLLFMGEESASSQPFLYFTHHRSAELAEAVRLGRIRGFATPAVSDDASEQAKIPVPNDPLTFEHSRLASVGEHGLPVTAWVRELLALRHKVIVPYLRNCTSLGVEVLGPQAVLACWQLGEGVLTLVVNLSSHSVGVAGAGRSAMPSALTETLFDSGGVRHALAAGLLPGHAFIALVERG